MEKKNEIVVRFQELLNNSSIESIIPEAESLMNDFQKVAEEQQAHLLNEFTSSGENPNFFVMKSRPSVYLLNANPISKTEGRALSNFARVSSVKPFALSDS